MKYSIILPTYNEALNVSAMVRSIRKLYGNEPEILIVDDRSPDGTFEQASAFASQIPNVRAFLHDGIRSLSASVLYGFDRATGDVLICMDADGQHRPEDLGKLFQSMEHNDMVVGSRYAEGGGFAEKWKFSRVLTSRTAALMAKLILKVRIQDPMSGFFAVRKEAYEKVRGELDPRGFKIMLEILSLLALFPNIRIAETGIVFAMRKHGASKLSANVIFQYLLMLKNSFLKQRKLKKRIALSA